MRAAGLEVVETASGGEALQYLRAGGFDGLVADLVMPGITGFDVLEKGKDLLPAKVVVTTALEDRDTEGLPANIKIIRKPYSVQEIIDFLKG